MTFHLPPKLVRGGIVVRYAALKADKGHRCVVVTAQSDSTKFNLFTLTAEWADSDWKVENGTLNITEVAAISMFRTYEQKD